MIKIKKLETQPEIEEVFHIISQLRPSLSNKESFAEQVMTQQKEGYIILSISDFDKIVGSVGYRFLTTLAFGKILYIDDLITEETSRYKGYGKILLDHVIKIAVENSCNEIHLDSGYTRHSGHKFYLKSGFELTAHHLKLKIY